VDQLHPKYVKYFGWVGGGELAKLIMCLPMYKSRFGMIFCTSCVSNIEEIL
jgi:hypothetical protein